MSAELKVLHVDAASGFYKTERFGVGGFWGPVDLGLFLVAHYNSLNIGTGLLAGSIFPGSNRLIFTGFSPSWGGFFISSMGGAGLVFQNLGIDLLAIRGKAPAPSVLYLNRNQGEEIMVEVRPVDVSRVWESGRGGVYSITDHVLEAFGDRYPTIDPRVLVTGPASIATDFGAIMSAPVKSGKVSFVDTWAGRGGLGSKMLREHGIAAVIYGGTVIDEDFRDRKVADQWFENRYHQKLAGKDLEATIKYRYDPSFNTGGTFGVNFATLGGRMISFNYRSMDWPEADRVALHKNLVLDHYLRQFNEETIETKNQKTCGEPCAALCKKLRGEFKKDYEPYQTMGPLCGIFDQRAAELLNHRADTLGFDAISVGGVLSWLMECVHEGVMKPEEVGASAAPVFTPEGFSVETDSMHNAKIGVEILDAIIEKKGIVDLRDGARKLARRLSRERGKKVLDLFVYNANARKGWIVPNQYWTPGALSPMPIMGKYYMYYGNEFVPPRELGRKNAQRMVKELLMDNTGFCRFHRGWVEEMLPDIIGSLYGMKDAYLERILITASRINSRNSSVFWESERNIDFVHAFLKRKRDVDGEKSPEFLAWLDAFEKDRHEAALNFWYEMHKGAHESLREF